jgi:hypothetical protein
MDGKNYYPCKDEVFKRKYQEVDAEENKVEISDGYHTFNELYDHRNLLFINLCMASGWPSAWKRDPSTPGWVILKITMALGQVSYHIHEKHLPLFEGKIQEVTDEMDWFYDGHTSKDVLERLEKAAGE